MTIFFNLENMEKEAGGDHVKLLRIFDAFLHKKLPGRYNSVPRTKLKLTGDSFLLNPEPLLEYIGKTDIAYIIQYLKLAAKRDYTLYKLYGVTGLLISYYPDIDLNKIRHNPLLEITETEIKFLFEDKRKK